MVVTPGSIPGTLQMLVFILLLTRRSLVSSRLCLFTKNNVKSNNMDNYIHLVFSIHQ